VDFLNPTFGPDELIGKTGEILGETPPSQLHREDASASVESASYAKAAPRTTTEGSPLLRILKAMGKKRSSLLRPAIGAAILLVIAGAGFLIYQQLMPARKAPAPSALIVRSPIPSKAPDAESKPQVPPERNVPDASAPVLPKPSTPPAKTPSLSLAESQPPGKHSYSVQLGAFKNERTAEALMKEFREKGYEAFIQPGVTKDKSPIYRVLVSKHENRKAAEKLAGEIRSKENTNAVLYTE
jgi:cell division septation protein DedD